MAQKDKELLDKLTSVFTELDRGRATTDDLNMVAKTLTELVVSFITATKAEKEAFFARVDTTLSESLRKLDEKVNKRISEVRDGVDGKDGEDGKTPIKGVDYFDGETPDIEEVVLQVLEQIPEQVHLTGEDMRNALEALPEGEKLSISAIEGLEEELKKVKRTGQSFGSVPSMVSNSPQHEAFTMDGVATTVTLTQAVAAQGTAVFVRYQGQLLDHTTMYTVNGNKITFVGFTPESGTIISVTYWMF